MRSTPKNNPNFKQKNRSLPAGSCLVSSLAEDLLKSSQELCKTLVILPTQRLQLYLTRELLQRSDGALILPRMTTWDSFLESLCSRILEKNTVMVSSQLELIMEAAIAECSAKVSPKRRFHANSAHAHELAYFYADLMRSNGLHSAKNAIVQKIESQWQRSTITIQTLLERIDDIFNVLGKFEEILESKNWTTKATQRFNLCNTLITQLDEQDSSESSSIFSNDRIIICGLTSLPKIEMKLLGKLNSLEIVEVWLDQPAPGKAESPLASLHKELDLSFHLAPTESWANGIKSITSATDITNECVAALDIAYELISSGTPAHEIAIIVPSENRYGPTFSALKDYFEEEASTLLKTPLTINLPLATSWQTSPPASWLHLLTETARSSDIGALGQYLLHPVTKRFFKGELLDFGLMQRKLKDIPEPRSGRTREFFDFIDATFNPSLASYIKEAWTWSTKNLDPKSDAPNMHTELMATKLLGVCSLYLEDTSKESSPHREAWRVLTDSITKACSLATVLNYSSADWTRFIEDIYKIAQEEVLRDTGEPLSGLQIIGLTEARYVPLTHAIIVGCVEGSFPHALPVDSLIDHSLRNAIGLPGWNELEALEDTTFHLLTCRISNVHLTYSTSDCDSPQIRSRWIEKLAVNKTVKEADRRKILRWLGCLSSEDEISTLSGLPAQEGQINELEPFITKASSSKLKSLLWCPYRYLLESQGISRVELPEDRLQQTIGQFLHKVLERFFNPTEINGIDPKLTLQHCPSTLQNFQSWAVNRLEAISKILVPQELQRSEDFQQMTGKGWSDIAKLWGALIECGFSIKTVTPELTIGNINPAKIEVAGQRIQIKGSIDAVHQSHDSAILIDYKTSTIPQRKDISKGLEPQLPLYSKAVSDAMVDDKNAKKIDTKNIAAMYFNLREGVASFAAIGENIKNTLLESGLLSKSSRADDMDHAIMSVHKRWEARLNAVIESRRFEADPSNCDFCPYLGICRKDDPRFKDAIAAQAKAGAS